jgi:hypothetical protein
MNNNKTILWLMRLLGETYKESLLKIREEKHKGKHGGAQVEAGSQESVFLPFMCF